MGKREKIRERNVNVNEPQAPQHIRKQYQQKPSYNIRPLFAKGYWYGKDKTGVQHHQFQCITGISYAYDVGTCAIYQARYLHIPVMLERYRLHGWG